MELLPELPRQAIMGFFEDLKRKFLTPEKVRILRRYRLIEWKHGQWRLSRNGEHAAKHYGCARIGETSEVSSATQASDWTATKLSSTVGPSSACT